MDFNNSLLNKNLKTVKGNDLISNNNNLKNPDLLQQISVGFDKNYRLIVLYFDAVNIESDNPNISLEGFEILKIFREIAKKVIPLFLKNAEILAIENLWGNDFIIITFVDKSTSLKNLPDISNNCSIYLQKEVNRYLSIDNKKKMFDFFIGYSFIEEKKANLEVQLYKSVLEAQEVSRNRVNVQSARLVYEFKETLSKELIDILYQPILSINTGSTFGWEALARGPSESFFYSPHNLFSYAENIKLLFPLEKVCRKVAIEKLGSIDSNQKLFINIHPKTISDPGFKAGETIKIIEENGLEPHNIVFEITERHHINDFKLINKIIGHYRSQGFLVAVDDVGSGFSSLQSIAELRPDFIKIDLSLIRGIHKNAVKKALMETMVIFAEKIGSSIIAEGVEDKDEYNALVMIGVHCIQGYYLGFPKNPKEAIVSLL